MDIEDVQEYIQSQYSNSPTIKQILLSLADNINPDADIDVFYQNIMNRDRLPPQSGRTAGSVLCDERGSAAKPAGRRLRDLPLGRVHPH